jgi:hypothetical protein
LASNACSRRWRVGVLAQTRVPAITVPAGLRAVAARELSSTVLDPSACDT